MSNVSQVTSGYRLKCGASGLFLSDATPQFQCITVTNRADLALPFPDLEAAEQARSIVSAMYGSFGWKPVEVQ